MQVYEVMTSTLWSVDPEATLEQAAKLMALAGIGALPVLDDDRLVGIVTDRDVTIRGTASALFPSAPVSAVMSRDVYACQADESIVDVLLDMELLRIHQMPVQDAEHQLVGMISLPDATAACGTDELDRRLKHSGRQGVAA